MDEFRLADWQDDNDKTADTKKSFVRLSLREKTRRNETTTTTATTTQTSTSLVEFCRSF